MWQWLCLNMRNFVIAITLLSAPFSFADALVGEGELLKMPMDSRMSVAHAMMDAAAMIRPLGILRASTLEAIQQTSAVLNSVDPRRRVRQDLAIVVDYNLDADQPRLFMFKKKLVGNQAVLEVHQFHVAHGGGNNYDRNFELRMSQASSREGTGLSSPGAYLAVHRKISPSYGPAFVLQGLEPSEAAGFGFRGNSNAFQRLIILHQQRVVTNEVTGRPYIRATRGCFGITSFGLDSIYEKLDESPQPTLIYSYWTRP